MYSAKNLKTKIKVTDITVDCPVKDCCRKVDRQRKSFKCEPQFKCPVHKIYISPSTFEYETPQDNLLWYNQQGKQLFEDISKFKRENRIARDNSEDALTWNVMIYLQNQGLIPQFLTKLSGKIINKAELILWSYSPSEKSSWSLLNEARTEFGEIISRGSEPDIIILTDKVLFFIEAKFSSKNETQPSDKINTKKYVTGGDNLFAKICTSDFESIAIKEKRYELLRFWVLGSWMAQRLDLDFQLVSLVIGNREQNLESEIRKYFIESFERKFKRITWEQIYDFILSTSDNKEKWIITEYFANKTIGYGSDSKLIKAFNI